MIIFASIMFIQFGFSINGTLFFLFFYLLGLFIILINYILEVRFVEISKQKIVLKYLFNHNRIIKLKEIKEIDISEDIGFRIRLKDGRYIDGNWSNNISNSILDIYKKETQNPIIKS